MSMAQSPTISIPKKRTGDVDWTGPIRTVISQSYGESPDNYASECAALQRCRQDAVKGAGSDATARDLLYKYFGQLELLELRFSEIRVVFPWYDAFTDKLTTQTSMAFEKASIIFQIAATHSSLGISQNRSDPEGLKRSFNYFRTAAGMLTYINDNFLHAPSTDLSKEVVKFLTGVMIAQATEVFCEKVIDEKKTPALISKVASQAAFLYSGLQEEVKEFMGKGIFDRNWVTIIQLKAKYFAAQSQHYRSIVDTAAGQHGESLARLTLAENLAKEAYRLGQTFHSNFFSTLTQTMPADAGTSILDITKAFSTLMTEKLAEASRDNDLIYNAIVPQEGTLPVIDKLSVATAIPIQEVYGNPDVQKVIGPDLFTKLIPLSVHESASVYSEEKAKLVRGEVDKAETADQEARVALDSLGLPAGLRKWRELANGGQDDGVPNEVERWAEEVTSGEGVQGIDRRFAELEGLKKQVDQELTNISNELDGESRECEAMRVKYELWEQEPSAGLTRSLRQDLKSHRDAFTAASSSDAQVIDLWRSVHPDLILLLSGKDALEGFFAAETAGTGSQGVNLLDIVDDPANDTQTIMADIKRKVDDIDERIGRMNKIKRERAEVLKDLKEKIQSDDVSHLLLLNRRSPNVEPGLFAVELEKFRPYQSRLAATVQMQTSTLDEITQTYRGLTTGVRGREWLKKADTKEKRIGDAIGRMSRAKDGWLETKATLNNGIKFYRDLLELVGDLRRSVTSFVNTRAAERTKLAAKAEAAQKASSSSGAHSAGPPPPLPPKSPQTTGVEHQFSSMGLGGARSPPPPPPVPQAPSWSPSQPSYAQPAPPPPAPYPTSRPSYSQSPVSPPPPASQGYNPFPPPPQPTRVASLPPPPPPPVSYQSPAATSPTPATDPYARLFDAPSISSQFSLSGQAPPPPPQAPSAPKYPPPPPSNLHQQGSYPPPPPQQQPYWQQPSSPYGQPPSNQYGQPQPQQQPYWNGQQWQQPPPPPANPPYGAYGR